jgi:hypothetical protein
MEFALMLEFLWDQLAHATRFYCLSLCLMPLLDLLEIIISLSLSNVTVLQRFVLKHLRVYREGNTSFCLSCSYSMSFIAVKYYYPMMSVSITMDIYLNKPVTKTFETRQSICGSFYAR